MTESCTLFGWLMQPSAERGIRFALGNGGWDTWSYVRLAERARLVAAGLRAAGVRRDDVVALVHESSPEFLAGFFGALLAGATPCPLAPPLTLQPAAAYREQLAPLLAATGARLVVTTAELREAIATVARALPVGAVVTVETLCERTAGAPLAGPAGEAKHALLQFTSGSSGTGKGLYLTRAALEANLRAIHRWLGWSADDVMASWLPVHHDMGLIGCVLWPVVNGNDLWLMRPEQFIRRPLAYLRCFGDGGATIGAIPPFALDYMVRRLQGASLDGIDLRRCKALIVGAERMAARTLEEFVALLEPCGLRRAAMVPAYGMAEATCAVTGVPLGSGWSALAVPAAALSPGRNVLAAGRDALAAAGPRGEKTRVVGCGRPLADTAVRVVREDGSEAPEGEVGEIVVASPSLASARVVTAEPSAPRPLDATLLRTGDAGFFVDGELYVIGRLGDSIKVRGRVVFAEDFELLLAAAGVPRARLAVLLGVHHGATTVVAVVEQQGGAAVQLAESALQAHAEGAAVHVVAAPRGTIRRTTSGKLRRRYMWQRFVDGALV